jgi:hypothetical protein
MGYPPPLHTGRDFHPIVKLILVISTSLAVAYGFWFLSAFGETTIQVPTLAGTDVNKTLTSNPSLNDGLVLHWTFDGKDMYQNVADISGRGNHGYLTDTSTSTTFGPIGQAFDFPSNSGHIRTAGTSFDDIPGLPLTIAAWSRAQAGNNGSFRGALTVRPGAGGGDTYYSIGWEGTGGRTSAAARNTTFTRILGPTIGHDRWVHIVGVFRATDDWALYVDGTLSASSNTDVPEITTIDHVNVHTGVLGSCWCDADDVRVYNRALSDEEIERLYELGATTHINTTIGTAGQDSTLSDGLVGHWTFDGRDMDIFAASGQVFDRSGYGLAGNVFGMGTGTTTAIGKIGQGLRFDGSDDAVILGVGAAEEAFSYAAWMRSNTGGPFLDGGACAGDFVSIGIVIAYDASRIGVYRPDHLSSCSLDLIAETAAVAQDGWNHVAVVYDPVDLNIYVNGEREEAAVEPGFVDYIENQESEGSGFSSIGAYRGDFFTGASATFFSGTLDDVRFYNRALSADEVRRLYHLGGRR